MKYSKEVIPKLEKFIGEMSRGTTPTEFWKHSSVHHIAELLDVSRETIYAWKNKYPEFSDTIKKWEEIRNARFLELTRKDGAWIFVAKNWLGMTDKQEIEHIGESKPLKIIVSDDGNGDGNK